MAVSVCCLLLVLAACSAVPVKPRTPRGIDCNRSGCYYLSEEEQTDEVSNPGNLTAAVLNALPEIMGSQNVMVHLMNKTQISQDRALDIAEHMLGDMDISLNDLSMIHNKTLISQDKTVGILEKVEVSIEKINSHLEKENQQIQNLTNTMTELMGKVVDLLEQKNSMTYIYLNSTEPILSGTELPPAKEFTSTRPTADEISTEMPPTKEFTSTIPATDKTSTDLPTGRDCQDLVDRGIDRSGLYVITPPDGLGSLDVYCDFIDNEGWTVFQRRYDGSVDFYRNWTEYENGFGDSNGEYWLGLKNIRRLISDGSIWALRVDLESFDGESAYAVYDYFSISDAVSNYRLAVGEYSGTAGDSLKVQTCCPIHNGMQFSTFDRDNDLWYGNCASTIQGAFWYKDCCSANLNGKYLGRAGTDDGIGMFWRTWKQEQSLKISEMKIRRV